MSPNPTIRRRTQHHEPFVIWNDEAHAPDPEPAPNPRLQVQEHMERLARGRPLPRSPAITLTMIEQFSREGTGEREMGLELETLVEEEEGEEEKEREDAEDERGKKKGKKMVEDKKGAGEPGMETGVGMGAEAQLGGETPVEMVTQVENGKRSGINKWVERKRLRTLLARLREKLKVMAIKVKNVLSI